MEVKEMAKKSVRNINRMAELLVISIVAFTTLFLFIVLRNSMISISFFLSIVSLVLILIMKKKKTFAPRYGFVAVWIFWFMQSVAFSRVQVHGDDTIDATGKQTQHGIGGIWSEIYSLFVFMPITYLSAYNYPQRFLDENRIYILCGLMILTCMAPVAGANLMVMSIEAAIGRGIMAVVVCSVMYLRFFWLDVDIPQKYGIVVMLNMLYVFEATIIMTIVCFIGQMILFAVVAILAHYGKKKVEANGHTLSEVG